MAESLQAQTVTIWSGGGYSHFMLLADWLGFALVIHSRSFLLRKASIGDVSNIIHAEVTRMRKKTVVLKSSAAGARVFRHSYDRHYIRITSINSINGEQMIPRLFWRHILRG
jgi:hypothetical protein